MNIHQKAMELLEKNEYEEDCADDWTESDKQAYIKRLRNEKKEFEQMLDQIRSGYIPIMEFETSIQTACYLFGCSRHGHAEYQD
ncbi:hypothetical protein [Brevibacillus daliensis]|uniref:hypothetical protein n=1 Tax=Brevibacillus daliensis TaxID=2892995 RepID=UPI001E4976BF|nr:hypothetical protein [Brevibacillus daliensis]